MPKSILYLTYDGLSDPLGQSQILPYLEGLGARGHAITIISFEKVKGAGFLGLGPRLNIIPLKYHKSPPVLSTLYDLYLLKRAVKKVLKTQKIDIVHCRSYVTSLVGLWAKHRFGTKFIFDMRGFWADERVEGGLWNMSNPLFRWVYGYFKKKERQFIEEANAVISLTENAKQEIEQWENFGSTVQQFNGKIDKIAVIPTCADMNHFNPERVSHEKIEGVKHELGIHQGDFVLLYLGSLGTWYMLEEMLDFYDILRSKMDKPRFLFVSPDQQVLKVALTSRNYNHGEIIHTSSSRADVPLFISVSSASIFFIKPSYSKKASAATKMGEIMAMGKASLHEHRLG
ncbi:MAG: glycosyltransferase [Cyclobacteriaceae bacterium]|nr:glycosyltransferase [Cyclobacteriaceae bacterium]